MEMHCCRSFGDITAVLGPQETECSFCGAALKKVLCWVAQATMHQAHFCGNEDRYLEQMQLSVCALLHVLLASMPAASV